MVALAGNPNVGKSTVFNALTGLRQHTGNWPGKTVTCAQGRAVHAGRGYILVDLPGTYSLMAHSEEEEAARDFLRSGQAQCVVVVCDAACLERNLILALQVLELTSRVVLCVNLLDEAEKRGIRVDLEKLSGRLGIPVVGTAAGQGLGLGELMAAVERVCAAPQEAEKGRGETPRPSEEVRGSSGGAACPGGGSAAAVPTPPPGTGGLDRVLTSRQTGIPVMLALLARGALADHHRVQHTV